LPPFRRGLVESPRDVVDLRISKRGGVKAIVGHVKDKPKMIARIIFILI
jgi:hypothetical protein